MENSFTKQFEIRWADIDSNRHLANSAISALMIETRMAFLKMYGFTYAYFQAEQMGPAILNESFYYMREILPDEKVTIDVHCLGFSEDRRFIRFGQSLFNGSGKQSVYHVVNFVWLDLVKRKIKPPTQKLIDMLEEMPRGKDFAILPQAAFLPPSNIPTNLKIEIPAES